MTNIQFNRSVIDAPGCISNAWELVKRNYWMYLGILIVAVIMVIIPLVGLFLAGPVFVGVYSVYLRDMRREPIDFGMMFGGFNKFVPAMAAGLLVAIPEIILQVVRITFRIGDLVLQSGAGHRDSSTDAVFAGLSLLYLAFVGVMVVIAIACRIAFFFVFPLMAEHDLGPIDALKLSASAAMANIGGLIVLFLIEFGLALVGVLACCIGGLFIAPVLFAANAFAYRQVFPLANQAPNAPPPPTAYGGQYGQGM